MPLHLPSPVLLLLPQWMPPVASREGLMLDRAMLLNLWIMLALLAAAHLLLATGLLLRPRKEPRGYAWVEWVPVAALAVLFGGLTLWSERLWAASRMTGASPTALQVEATGMQFAWYFRYPGPDFAFGRLRPELADPGLGDPLGLDPTDPRGHDDLVTSELVLPANREVDIHLHAQDVIHGFAIPALRVKQNAVPGLPGHIHFTPDRVGTYAIVCTQVCGTGHFRMAATLRVLTPEAYAAWLHAHEAAQ